MLRKVLFWCALLLFSLMGSLYAQKAPRAEAGLTVGNGTIPEPTTRYEIVFEGLWSQSTHPHPDGPGSFPSTAHFSPLIGALHNDGVSFWQAGTLASPGLEDVAETGAIGVFSQEIASAITGGNASLRLGPGTNVGSTGLYTFTNVPVNAQHPRLTLVTMIAPSPDWFAGVSGLSLRDASGQWVNELVIDLYPFDAGTEEGTDYATFNPPTSPPQPVTSLAGQAPFSTKPVARLTVRRLPPQHTVWLPLVVVGN